ncbi:hypothetical protein SAMN02910358_01175 [Lachnospiraceae bacterium XBB1006]|nr:hypothetical protein SAMN02910358_01175 [Lachnospiraceae bacterium XBB1006]
MVSNFLKSRLQVHLNLLDSYLNEQREWKIKILETEKFINILSTNACNFDDSFSPYQSDNVDLKKIIELRSELRLAREKMNDCLHKIDEESSLIEQYKSAIIEVELLENK